MSSQQRCPSCSGEVAQGQRFCGGCGAAMPALSSAPTSTSLPSEAPRPEAARATDAALPSSSSSLDQGRFLPGAMLAERYRVAGLLGRGGMGEVYRADDLKLGQPVALKFLPPDFEMDEGRLARFMSEVRTARQVTHPNVCRVYDVGEVDGKHFISMEYVDGEDLATLLRRIGRLPRDKAVQIARQLCAGLAAAHDEGILHRDLKPANVMIDGRGRARITDFGLASLAGEVREGEVRAGTPTYMAPEQLAGKEVTVRSDIYSLGLVLYELFTGKTAFEAKTIDELARLKQSTTPTSPSSHVEGFDPVVERVILQCLDPEPADRSRSALAVAAALPGGDPLAAALAAGETPSPEMVAAAGPQGGLTPVVAQVCVALIVAGTVLGAFLAGKTTILSRVPMSKSIEALRENAREILQKLGYTDRPADSDAWFSINFGEVIHVAESAKVSSDWDAELSRPGQWFVGFHYRQGDDSLVPRDLWGEVSGNDPPSQPGDIRLGLDLEGKLLRLQATPARVDHARDPPPPVDWVPLFEAAGLEMNGFEEAAPTMQPQVLGDTRMAWTGALSRLGGRPGRVEAVSLRGKPLYFEVITTSDWYWSPETVAESETAGARPAFMNFLLMVVVLLALGALYLAIRNLRIGRGDRSGALKLAVAILVLRLLQWTFTGHHVAGVGELSLLVTALASALLLALLTWVLYMALEPYIRRLWPESIVSWSRLLAGRFRDPLIGRDILVGGAFSAVAGLMAFCMIYWGQRWGDMFPIPNQDVLRPLRGGRYALGELFAQPMASIAVAMSFVLLFLLFRIMLRRQFLAAAAFWIVYTVYACMVTTSIGGFSVPKLVVGILWGVILSISVITLLVRFGLLAAVAYFLTGSLAGSYPLTTDVSAPYFALGLVGPAVLAALIAYGFLIALGGQRVFRDDVLAEARS